LAYNLIFFWFVFCLKFYFHSPNPTPCVFCIFFFFFSFSFPSRALTHTGRFKRFWVRGHRFFLEWDFFSFGCDFFIYSILCDLSVQVRTILPVGSVSAVSRFFLPRYYRDGVIFPGLCHCTALAFLSLVFFFFLVSLFLLVCPSFSFFFSPWFRSFLF